MGYGLDESSESGKLHGGEMIITQLGEYSTIEARAGESGQMTCSGDSGEPALFDLYGTKIIIGVTSYGSVMCDNYSGFSSPYFNREFLYQYAPEATYY